jgi:predicted small secreted protein
VCLIAAMKKRENGLLDGKYGADPNKEVEMKRLLLALAVGTLLAAGCNTIHGMGRDIERGGEATQDAADAVQKSR